MIKAVFLDFDGVIMDSMDLKLDSYCYALSEFQFPRDEIRKIQTASAGLSRFKVIPLMYTALTGKSMPEDLFQHSLELFTHHDEDARAKMVLKQGTMGFFEYAQKAELPLSIVTGTPQEVIDKTLEFHSLRTIFAQVKGSPGSKPLHLQTLLRYFECSPTQTLYIGDAIMDQEASRSVGIPFVGINNGDNPFKSDYLWAELPHLGELTSLLSSS